MQKLAALLGTLHPKVAATIISPLRPYLVECRNVVTGVGEALAETVRRKGDEFCLRVDEIHLLGGRCLLLVVGCLLSTETSEAAKSCGTGLGLIFFRLYAVQDVLCLGLVVDAAIIAPLVGSEDQRSDEIQLSVGGSAWGVTGTVGLATPCEIALADAILVLHVFLCPSPQTVEDVFLVQLYGNHHAV